MSYRPIGPGVSGVSRDWEQIPGDAEVAREVVEFFKDQRMLFGKASLWDELECVAVAIKSRTFLTEELAKARVGSSLAHRMRAMRAALRTFMDAAGPDARNFRGLSGRGTDLYGRAHETLRALLGLHLRIVVDQYAIEIEPDLAEILPSDASVDDVGPP